MILDKFPSWMIGPILKKWHDVSEKTWTAMEQKMPAVFKAGRIRTTGATGLEILWDDLEIKPPVPESRRRSLLQNYDAFIENVGTPLADRVIENVLNIENIHSIDMRDHPKFAHLYRFWAVRFYIQPEHVPVVEKIREQIKIMLPARCLFHYQIVVLRDDGCPRRKLGRRTVRR